MKDTCMRRILVNRELKQRRRRRQREGKKAIGLYWQNINFVRASRFFAHFFAVVARLQRETPTYTFYGGREHMYNNLDTVL